MLKVLTLAAAVLLFSDLALAKRGQVFRSMAKVMVQKYSRVQTQKIIRLQDIAKFEGLPKAAEETLSRVKVGQAPPVGEKIHYTSRGLSEVFRSHLSKVQNKYGVRIMLSVPQSVVVYNESMAFNEEEFKKRMESYFSAQCEECRYEISHVQMPRVSDSLLKNPWVIDFGRSRIRGSFSLPVYFSKKESKKIFWVSGHASKWMKVPVANRRITAGERIDTKDYELKEMDVTFSDDSPARLDQLANVKMRRGLAAGAVIWQNSLYKEKAIRFGDMTKVLVGSDSWQVTISAVAQQGGDIGDRIRLINPKTRNNIMAKVIGPKLVRLEAW